MRVRFTSLVMWSFLVCAMPIQAGEASHFDWKPWRYLPVQDSGRQKPLDTLAWETLRTLANRTRIADPESGQQLHASVWYLCMLLDWRGWDETMQQPPRQGQGSFQIPQPDKWDRVPLLRVNSPALGKALGLIEQQKYVSPLELSQSKISVAESGEDKPFLPWAAALAAQQQEELSELEKRAVEVAGKFWAYQDHRTGLQLVVVSPPGSADQPWVSLSEIVHNKWENTADPTGRWRAVRRQFLAVRAAYLADCPQEFHRASTVFLSMIQAARSAIEYVCAGGKDRSGSGL